MGSYLKETFCTVSVFMNNFHETFVLVRFCCCYQFVSIWEEGRMLNVEINVRLLVTGEGYSFKCKGQTLPPPSKTPGNDFHEQEFSWLPNLSYQATD